MTIYPTVRKINNFINNYYKDRMGESFRNIPVSLYCHKPFYQKYNGINKMVYISYPTLHDVGYKNKQFDIEKSKLIRRLSFR